MLFKKNTIEVILIPQKPFSKDGTTTSNTNVKPQTLIDSHSKKNYFIKMFENIDKILKVIAEAVYTPRKITSFAEKMWCSAI